MPTFPDHIPYPPCLPVFIYLLLGSKYVTLAAVPMLRPTDDQVRAIITPLYALSTGIHRVIADKPEVSRLAVLQAINYSGRIRPTQIAEALNIRQSQVTRQIQALETSGFVEVSSNPDDRRSWIVTLTDSGKAEIERLTGVGMAKWRRFLADWELSEVDELARLLAKLHTSITETRAVAPVRRRA